MPVKPAAGVTVMVEVLPVVVPGDETLMAVPATVKDGDAAVVAKERMLLRLYPRCFAPRAGSNM